MYALLSLANLLLVVAALVCGWPLIVTAAPCVALIVLGAAEVAEAIEG